MNRFISVDWDFFIDATFDQRVMMFPDGGNENLPTSLRDYIWDTHYRHPELKNMKVTSDYKYLLSICKTFQGEAFVADSHRWAFNFIMDNTKPDEVFEVWNIDFHHDLYNFTTRGGEVNCGNWATMLQKYRPNMKYKWVCCETSDATAGEDVVDVETYTMDEFRMQFRDTPEDFQYLFMCRSAVWSPPHLDKKFVIAVKAIKCKLTLEQGITRPRPYEIPTELDEFKAFANLIKSSKEDSE